MRKPPGTARAVPGGCRAHDRPEGRPLALERSSSLAPRASRYRQPYAAHMGVYGLDHVVLRVADGERALAFYCGRLGLEPVRADAWRRGEVPFPSARVDEATLIDLLPGRRTGENLDHLCLVVERSDVDAATASGDLEVIEGPVTRFGARGDGTSVYVRDPDGNVIELRCYD